MGNALVRVNGKAYEVIGSLGEGGFAHVYEVRRDGRRFALKWTRGVTEGEDLERLLLEIQVLRRLRHPNVLTLSAAEVRKCQRSPSGTTAAMRLRSANRQMQQFAVGDGDSSTEKEVFMLFPIATRGSLQTYLDRASLDQIPAFTESECLRFFSLLVDAVAALHDLDFAHRDLKPANILLTSDDPVQPLVVDFGSVAPLTVTLRNSKDGMKLWEEAARFSSAPFRAPELWEAGSHAATHGPIDGRTDVWALGCVLYAMAFGPLSPFEHPRDGVQQYAILSGNVRFPPGNRRFGQTFTSEFTALIEWLLTAEADERPTLDQVRQRVQQLRSAADKTKGFDSVRQRRMSSWLMGGHAQAPEDDWADFAVFDDPNSQASEVSGSEPVQTWSSPAVFTNRASIKVSSSNSNSTRELACKRKNSSLLLGSKTRETLIRPVSRRRVQSESSRRRALSHTGKRLWMSALEASSSE